MVIGDTMIDCGVSFKGIKKHLYGIKYLLITHIHSDHLKIPTYNKIRRQFPRIKIIGNYEVAQKVMVDVISNEGYPVELKRQTFIPFAGIHDCVVHGYVWKHKGEQVIYCTDTATLENAPNQKYDWLFLESNHDEVKLEQVKNQSKKYGYDAYKSSLRHLSTQKSKAFYYTHRRSKDSQWIELHQSTRFY